MSQSEWENLSSLLSLAVGMIAALFLLIGIVPARAMNAIEQVFRSLANRPKLCAIGLATLSLAVSFSVTWRDGIPQPRVHDEFSYLLAADTFSHGRITNPTPPYSEHLETPQQLLRPTYMSKYPPGQGIALAVGQILIGRPIVGAWLAAAMAVVAIYWMLLSFAPRPWALLGGLIAALQTQLVDWTQVYWGGSVAVMGGALLLGAWGRLMISGSAQQSLVLAAGLIILANSRPFEGLVLSIPLLIALLMKDRKRLLPIIITACIPLLLAGAAMAYYDFRITGRPFRFPYFEYASQYEIYPKFWMLPPGPTPTYHNGAMEFIHRYFERDAYAAFSTIPNAIGQTKYRFNLLFITTLSQAILLLPFIAAVVAKKDVRSRWLITAGGLSIAGLWTELFVFNHYAAPLVPLVILLVIRGWQIVQSWHWRGRQIGPALARATAVGFLAGAVMAISHSPKHDPDMLDQQATIVQLAPLHQGRHVVFVSYAPLHSYHAELVHNLSNPDQSRIIWLRSLGPEEDRKALRWFADRQIWSLYVGGKLVLKPFPPRDEKSTTN